MRDATGAIVNHIMLVRDRTYEMGLEKRLRQAEKLEAIGVLAGGVAHDFNNILTPILLNTEMILADIPWRHPLRRPLADVVRASERARDLVRQLLTFSRQGELTVSELPLTPLVRETVRLIRGMVDARVEIRPKVSDRPLIIEGDPAQIHQVLMNLCLNAAQAMPDGGVMEVGLAAVAAPPRPRGGAGAAGLPLSRLAPGPYVRLWVSDTGHGMAPDICERNLRAVFHHQAAGPGHGHGAGRRARHRQKLRRRDTGDERARPGKPVRGLPAAVAPAGRRRRQLRGVSSSSYSRQPGPSKCHHSEGSGSKPCRAMAASRSLALARGGRIAAGVSRGGPFR